MRRHRKSRPPKAKTCFIHKWHWEQIGTIHYMPSGRQYVTEQKSCTRCPTYKKPKRRRLR